MIIILLKNVTCLKIWHLFVIFLQNEASHTVTNRELLYF